MAAGSEPVEAEVEDTRACVCARVHGSPSLRLKIGHSVIYKEAS